MTPFACVFKGQSVYLYYSLYTHDKMSTHTCLTCANYEAYVVCGYECII